MKYYNLMSITISQLVIFQAAATLNSFTKAAQKQASAKAFHRSKRSWTLCFLSD